MKVVNLIEYKTTEAVPAGESELEVLRGVTDLTISPTRGQPGCFDITPGSTVGAIYIGERVIHIRPKIPIDRLFFLLSYSVDPRQWDGQPVDLDHDDSVVEAVIPGFIWQVRRALARGPLQGYRQEESALVGLRGRLRLEDQLRGHFGMAPPLECRYDQFTIDIEENRIVRAAINALKRLHIRSDDVGRSLRNFDSALDGVTSTVYDPRKFPAIVFTRLNRHYKAAIRLSRLILSATSPELISGTIRSSAFLVDMNDVFENFLVVSLREALGLSEGNFPQGCQSRSLFLDEKRAVNLKPDISWWHGSQCIFVGDVKYKRIDVVGAKHADLYQLLAYAIGSRLPGGMLIYAAGEGVVAQHRTVQAGKTLNVVSLDLCSTPTEILGRIANIAAQIRAMCYTPG